MCCLIQVSAGMLINQTNKTECKNRTAEKTAKSSVSKRLLAMQEKPSCSACTYLYEHRWTSSALGLQGECNYDLETEKNNWMVFVPVHWRQAVLTWTNTAGMNKCCHYSFLERCKPAEKWKFPMQTILWGLSSETSPTYPGNMFPIWLHP